MTHSENFTDYQRTQKYLEAIEAEGLRNAVTRLLQTYFQLSRQRLVTRTMFGGDFAAAMEERGVANWTDQDVLDIYLMETAHDELLRSFAFDIPSAHDFYQLR